MILNQTITINPTTPADVSALLDIYNYYVLNSTATFHEKPITEAEMNQLLFFDNPRHASFVIKQGSNICGYCILSKHHVRSAYDHTGNVGIYLDRHYLQQGIGSQALDFLHQWAREKNYHTLISIISAENEGSIRLFERKGYFKCAHLKEVGLKFDRLLDVVYYQKIL